MTYLNRNICTFLIGKIGTKCGKNCTYNNGGKIVQKLGSYKTSKWQKDSKIFKITRFEIVKKIEAKVVQNLYKNYFKDCEKIVERQFQNILLLQYSLTKLLYDKSIRLFSL